jgi:uncharacterized membrane protein HdeD (DUF308 family)
MTATRITGLRSPGWIRALQIGIGAVAIGLSISSMIYPAYAVVATFVAAGIILFLIGIEEIVAGIFLYRRSRLTHIGLGALIIILASLVMAFPLPTATLLIWVTAFALLFGGIASIASGFRGRNRVVKTGRASRALSVGAGALAVAFAIAIILSPTFGVGLTGVLIGIALLFLGVRLVVRGIVGRGYAMAPSSADTMAA